MTADPSIVAAYRRAFARQGVAVPVTLTRITGFAPNTATVSADIVAIVRDYMPDTTAVAETGFAAGKQGAITQGDRMIIVMIDDLAQKRFPLPVRKNDRLTLRSDAGHLGASGDVLNVVAVDALKRAAGGAIELKAAGVA
jgi:hypothetical protein